MCEIIYFMLCVQGRSGLAGSQTGRSFPRRSFARPSWMDEDTVDSADASESLFFSKVSRHCLNLPVESIRNNFSLCLTFFWPFFFLISLPLPEWVNSQTTHNFYTFHCLSASLISHPSSAATFFLFLIFTSFLLCL